jgi:hypothetical protein
MSDSTDLSDIYNAIERISIPAELDERRELIKQYFGIVASLSTTSTFDDDYKGAVLMADYVLGRLDEKVSL